MATIRPRNTKADFEIHHDETEGSTDEEQQEMEDSRVEEEEEEEDEEDVLSEASEESDNNVAVDPAVQEDIEKFQRTFDGITDRFRLINRIGEGKSDSMGL
jgi:hypothetical protein